MCVFLFIVSILPPSMVKTKFFCAIKTESKNKTYPLSTRKESLQVLLFLLNWNLGGKKRYPVEPLLIFALNKHTLRSQMSSLYSSDMALHVNTRPKLYFKARQILRRHRAALIWSISNAILKASAECHNTGRKSSACVLTY